MRMQTRQDHIDPLVTKVTRCRYSDRAIDVQFTNGTFACSASVHVLSLQDHLPTLRTPDRDEALWIRAHALEIAKIIPVELCPSHEGPTPWGEEYSWGQEGHLYTAGNQLTLTLCMPRR